MINSGVASHADQWLPHYKGYQHMKDKGREEWHWMFTQLSTWDKILVWLFLQKLLVRRAMIVRVEKAKAGAARVVRAFKK